jgi:hypothetical protein
MDTKEEQYEISRGPLLHMVKIARAMPGDTRITIVGYGAGAHYRKIRRPEQ